MITKHTLIRLAAAGAAAMSLVLAQTAPALAAKPISSNKPGQAALGNDISWPQCNKQLPAGQAFGIVGITGGTAIKDNPCLNTELQWASRSSGLLAKQPKIQLYVNTANPGDLGVASWPVSDIDPMNNAAPNPYSPCDGSDSDACAWQYGWNRMAEDVQDRFLPAAHSAGLNADPTQYPWWLDVETVNSWESGSTAALMRNARDLEGMMAYLKTLGVATAGIYSTGYQWDQIVGKTVAADSNLNNSYSWLAGSSSSSAQKDCLKPALTTGSTVAMTQFVANRYDYDYSCL